MTNTEGVREVQAWRYVFWKEPLPKEVSRRMQIEM